MRNQFLTRLNRWMIALIGVMVLSIADAYAGGEVYSRASAYLKAGAPTGGGKVYVGGGEKSSSPGTYAAFSNYTSAASSDKKKGASTTTTYHFWAQANTSYKFMGWYSKGTDGSYTLVSTNTHFTHGVNSGSAPSDGTAYVDYDLYADFIKIVQLSFIAPTNGSYTIKHKGVAVADYASFTVDGNVELTATPAAGYKLRGWYTTTNGGATKKYFAFENKIEPKLTDNATIGADFVPDDGKAVFWPKGSSSVYDDMNTAFDKCGSGGAVVVVSNGVLAAGNYTIPANKSLIIPSSSTASVMTEPAIVHVTAATSAPALSAYRTLSLADGANITVNGTICVAGQVASVNGGNATSFPCGTVGVLDLSKGGSITLNSGAFLYAWGLVTGQNMDEGNNTTGVGHITAKSGSTVWEDFQVGDWRGGTASSSIYSNRTKWRFFPFQTWTVQNIEAPITFERGSTGKCFFTLFGDGKVYPATLNYTANSGSLFLLGGSSATLEKWYDATTDKVCYQLSGTTKLTSMTVSVAGMSIKSDEFTLPMPCNMRVILKSGTFTMDKPVAMHAGSSMEVKSGATLSVNTNVYMFDQADWDKYCMYYGGSNAYFQKFNTITKHYDRGDRTSKAKLTDASILVNGTLSVTSSGSLYSTAGGCQITGDGGGVVQYASSLPSSTTIIMCTTLKDTKNVSVANVNLLNENGKYTKSIGSTTFDNVNGRWFIRSAKDPKPEDHTWDFTYIKSGANTGTGGTNGIVSAVYSHDKTGTYDRMKWFDVTPDECDDWWKDASSYLYNWTLNGAWHQFIPTATPNVYSGSDNMMHQKGANCTWDQPDYPFEDCFYIVAGVPKAFVGGELIAVTANNPDDHAWHKTDDASKYYICLADCNWRAATKVAGKQQAYTTIIGSKTYIWYNGAWTEVVWDDDLDYYFSTATTGQKTYYDFISGAWTIVQSVAEVTNRGKVFEYIRLSEAMNAVDTATAATTIRLLQDVEVTSSVRYTGNQTCTFNLNGHTLSGAINNLLVINNASATFIVNDAAGTGKIDMTILSAVRDTAVNVKNGHLILNSGTIYAKNTHASQATTAINVAKGKQLTINGGRVEAVSAGETWAIHIDGNSNTTSLVTINGGLVKDSTSATGEVSVRGIHSEGGMIRQNGGRVEAHAPSGNTGVAMAIRLDNTNGRYEMNGGTAYVLADTKVYTLYLNHSGAKATLNSGTVEAHARTSSAYALVTSGQVTINEGMILKADATSVARAINTSGATHKTWVNGGKFYARTTSGANAFGLYAQKGTDTINGGEFYVTAFTKDAYGVYAANDASAIVVVNGGKFMIHDTDSAGTSKSYCCGTAGTEDNMKIAGGYYNIDRNLDTYKISGKNKKPITSESNPDLYAQGYNWKVVNDEFTVTFKHSMTEEVLQSGLVESTKVPVYTGAAIGEYAASENDDTYEFIGWSTTKNGSPAPLAPVAGSNVTYWAVFKKVYADVTIGATTTRYDDSNGGVAAAWSAALAASTGQATIKVLSNADNLAQLTAFAPSQAEAIITLNLNGRHWGMDGTNDTPSGNNWFIKINKSDSKLIITDNSVQGKGYIHTSWAKSAALSCVLVSSGELVLERGAIKCDNTDASKDATAVSVNGSGTFTMLGGTVDARKSNAEATGGYAYAVSSAGTTELAAGKITAVHSGTSAGEIRCVNASSNNEINLGEGIELDITGYKAYALYGLGSINVNGGTYKVTGTNTAQAIRPTQKDDKAGSVHISGNPTFIVKSPTDAYGIYVGSVNDSPTNVVVEVDTAAFDVQATTGGTAYGIYNSYGTVTVHNAKIDVLTHASTAYVLYAHRGSSTSIESGTYNLLTDTTASTRNDVDIIRNMGFGSQIDITGGAFEVKNNGSSSGTSYILRTNGGSTSISGTPTFKSSYRGIFAIYNNNANDDLTADVIIDGGAFESYQYVLQSNTSTNANATRGNITIWDGKFKVNNSLIRNDGTNTPVDNLNIRGGYYSATTASTYVKSPSVGVELKSGDEFYPEYKYHVITKHNITWNNGTSDIRTDEVTHNDMPSFGAEVPVHPGTETYDFVEWNTAIDGSGDTVMVAKRDLTYYAQWRKIEAEVVEGEEEGKRFESFEKAFAYAKNLPIATIKALSDVTLTKALVQDSLAELTIDLNGHTITHTDTAIVMDYEGMTLTIKDSQTGGKILVEASKAATLYAAVVNNGELRLEGGELSVQNSQDAQAAYAVEAKAGATFSMTGGTLAANAKTDARAMSAGGADCAFNISGGTVNVSTEAPTDTWGDYAYGIKLDGNGTAVISGNPTFNVDAGQYAYGVYTNGSGISATVDGTAAFNATAHTYDGSNVSRAYGFYVDASSTIHVNGGTYTVRVPDSKKECYGAYVIGTANFAGGTFDVRDTKGDGDNIDVIRAAAASSVVNITGGTFNSSQNGIRAMGGTTTISGNPTFNNANICVAAAYYSGINGTANVTIYGGTFTTTNNYPLYPAWRKVNASTIANSNIVVYGGYFKGKGSYVAYKYVDGDGTASLTLYGGYFAGQKIRYNTSPSASDHNWDAAGYNRLGDGTAVTSVPNPSTEYTAGYRYKLETSHTITWTYGDASVDSTVVHGFVPYKNDIVTYISGSKEYYFTGWTPTPVAATTDATYTATGVAYDASVTVGETTTYYATLAEAWEFALNHSEATITLLNNVTTADQLTYRPAVESARHTLDLNNRTLSYSGSSNTLLMINRAEAQLTITDHSVGGNGKLTNEVAYDGTNQAVIVSYGELVLEKGEISVLNTRSGQSGYAITARNRGIFTMTDGTVKAVAKTGARAINTTGTTTVNISGGQIIANTYISSTYGADAYGIVSYGSSTIHISDDPTFTIDASSNAMGLMMSSPGVTATLDGGLFNVTAQTTTSAKGIHAQDSSTVIVNYCEIHADAKTTNAYAVYVKDSATITVNDGEFEAYAHATGTGSKAVSAAYAGGGTITIVDGEFYVDVADHQGDNVNVVRVDNDSYMNISGGTFNMDASSATQSGNAIRAFGGTTTISGTPTFTAINGVYAGGWAIGDGGAYTAYVIIDGGTFDVSSYAIYASKSEHDGKYASADVTVNGGFFKTSGSKIINKGADGTITTVSLALQGGYYSNNKVNGSPSNIDGHTVAPYFARTTTSDEKAAVGSDYLYRVVESPRLDVVDWTTTTLTLNANGWLASGWPYTINGTVYQNTDRAADRTLTIPYSGAAGSNLAVTLMSGGAISGRHNYRIPFIGTTVGAGADDIVYVNEGTLTINASSTPHLAALYICPGARVNVTNGTLAIDKLVIRTLPWQSGAISGAFTATETWYTRIAPNKRTITGHPSPITYESARYYQFALPFGCTAKLKDIQVSHGANTPYGNAWLLKRYNEQTRATNGMDGANWDALDKEDYIQGGVGYEIFSNSNYYREFYFPVDISEPTTSVAVSHTDGDPRDAGWNWVVSPLMSVYDNSGANPETGLKIGLLTSDGTYDQGIFSEIDPCIPFVYQASSGQSTISFAGNSIVASAPQRRVAAEDEPERIQWIHLDIQDENGIGDHTSVLSHPSRYEQSYKTGIDMAKQSLEASRAIIYSSHAYGEMAFAGVADSLLERGVALTVYSPSAQELTISMRNNDWLNRLAYVWLIDHQTGARTDLLWDTYIFNATEGTMRGRFTIEGVFRTPQVTTDIEPTSDSSLKGREEVRKVIINQKMYILIGDQMFDATGKKVEDK